MVLAYFLLKYGYWPIIYKYLRFGVIWDKPLDLPILGKYRHFGLFWTKNLVLAFLGPKSAVMPFVGHNLDFGRICAKIWVWA